MSPELKSLVVNVAYLLSAVMFIFGLKRLTKVRTARRGNAIAALAMFVAVAATLVDMGLVDYRWILIGIVVGGAIGGVAAMRVPMTSMPELVAVFNGFGGGASTLVAMSVVWLDVIEPGKQGTLAHVLNKDGSGGAVAITIALSVLIGAVTLTGSVVAYLKLAEKI
ncbi:MAG: NAD(P)(+) transhydrogenase (Re/Si-specific) subunit beta, partial [Myxococcales bacterium]|nr:NAD(P)(+) transhydrogenase (Re/Si-specific) subunit beta [Myxococcales bacterium]